MARRPPVRPVRVRLAIDLAVCGSAAPSKCWYEVPDVQHSVADFRDYLTERFAISKPRDSLQLTVDGYALLPDAALTILRDGDLISVAATAPALPAVAKGRRKRALPDAELEQPVKKRRTAAKAAKLALEAPPVQAAATPSGPSAQASSSSEASRLTNDGAEVQKPADTPKASRNARRKAVKRRLRREGVLPYKGRSSGKPPARPTAAEAADPLDPNKSTAAPSVVAASAARAGTPSSQKHIHFERSDGEEPPAPAAAIGSLPAAAVAAVGEADVPAAVLPAPTASKPAALQRAASANGSAPAVRANTLAEVFAARSQATEAHANGRSSPHVGATSRQPDVNHASQLNGPTYRQQKRRYVREPQVAHDQLPALQGPPQPGDIISYKLLEIGVDYTPQVSLPRLGKLTACDAASGRVSVVPWPDPSLHPVLAEQALADGFDHYFEPNSDADDDADQLEEPPSDYSRSGELDADLSSLQDVRLVAAAAGSATADAEAGTAALHAATFRSAASGAFNGGASAGARGSGESHAGGSDTGGGRGPGRLPAAVAAERLTADAPQSRSGLGPPRPGSTGRPTGPPSAKGWADVAAALRLRRMELLAKQEALSDQSAQAPAAETASASATAAVLHNSHSAVEPAAVIDRVRKVAASVATPSAVRPRGGVRQSALGPLLARLRSEPGS